MRDEDHESEIGLYSKFSVHREDGSSGPGGKHERCTFFVLDLNHDPFAVPAIRAYADACEAKYPELARDLRHEANARDPVALAAYDAHQDAALIRLQTQDLLRVLHQMGLPPHMMKAWMLAPLPLFCGRTAQDLIQEGEGQLLIDHLLAYLSGKVGT